MAKKISELSDVELEQQILKFRQLCQKNTVPDQTKQILLNLIEEQKNRTIEELGFQDTPSSPAFADSVPRLRTTEARHSGRINRNQKVKHRRGTKGGSRVHPPSGSRLAQHRGQVKRKRHDTDHEANSKTLYLLIALLVLSGMAALVYYFLYLK